MRTRTPDDELAHPVGDRVDVVDIEVKAEGIVLDVCRPAGRVAQVKVPAAAVLQNAIFAPVGREGEAQPGVEGGAGGEVAARHDGDDMVPQDRRHLRIDDRAGIAVAVAHATAIAEQLSIGVRAGAGRADGDPIGEGSGAGRLCDDHVAGEWAGVDVAHLLIVVAAGLVREDGGEAVGGPVVGEQRGGDALVAVGAVQAADAEQQQRGMVARVDDACGEQVVRLGIGIGAAGWREQARDIGLAGATGMTEAQVDRAGDGAVAEDRIGDGRSLRRGEAPRGAGGEGAGEVDRGRQRRRGGAGGGDQEQGEQRHKHASFAGEAPAICAILACDVERSWYIAIVGFAPRAGPGDEARLFEQVQMFGDGLAGHACMRCQPGDRPGDAAA
ncbi:hypothetical protein WR25_16011 [Diploscapter pachys]|uniref:Uncharacterized protein n=1 Tax=Diploscapter pachys TaxID=2018661 RepID=A0A2A2K815_9BILA|nr:hypothetical protein WR25_16011 [Diploscapter pachys]